MDYGLEKAGMECQWQVEIDKHCQKVLTQHWPDIPLHSDVREVSSSNLPPVDVLAGGSPCTDVSKAGKREGLKGARSGLFFEYARLVDELRPEWLIFENVPGLLSSNSGRDMGTVLGTLGDLGYGWAYRVLDARFFGSPQRRRRLFLVGHSGDSEPARRVLLGPGSGAGDPGSDIGPKRSSGPSAGSGVASAFVTFRKSRRPQNASQFETWVEDDFCNCLTRWDTGLVRSTTLIVEPAGARVMTPAEWEAAQGLPMGWAERIPGFTRCKALGDAVNANVAEWIGRRVLGAQKGEL